MVTVFFDIIFIAACVVIFYFLIRSFGKNPFAYRNIAMTSVIILLLALITGRSLFSGTFFTGRSSLSEAAVTFIWQFSRILLIPLSFLCLFLCISNAALLKHEGFRKSNFLGLLFSLSYLITISLVWRPFNAMPHVMDRFLIFLRLLLCYGECTLLSVCILGYAVLKTKPSYDRDFVIILGCSISRKGKVRPLLKGRVNRAIRFAWDQEIHSGKSVKYVPSGGQGEDEPMSEGSAMEMYLLSHSAEDYEIFPENKSRNTRENMLFSKRIIDEKMPDANIMIVTTNFHVLRSGMLARRAGLMNSQVIGSGTMWYFWPNAFLRETAAIMLMFSYVHLIMMILFFIISFCL